VNTRPSTPGDREFLHELHHATYRDVVIRQFGIWDEQRQDESFVQTLADCEFRIVEVDGVAVGAIGVDERDDCVRLVELQILPARQGKGLGSALLHNLMLHAKSKNKSIRLRVLRESRARSLYERNGFAVIEDAGHVYVMEWQPR
jgi:GNAT superfamily N-acetyltransferase